MTYAIFDLITGRILRLVQCPAVRVMDQLQPGEGAIEIAAAADDRAHYVGGAPGGLGLVERPRLAPPPEAMAVGEVAALALPAQTRIEIDGADRGASDGEPVELSFAVDGVYRLALSPPFPYQPLALDVTVSAS